jgi:hypothetical protein
LDIGLALVAALLFALGTVLRQKAGLEGPDAMEGASSGLLLRMARKPVWLADVAAAVLVTVSLIAFLTIANPTGGRNDAPFRQWLVLGAIIAGVCIPLTLASLKTAARLSGPIAAESRRRRSILACATTASRLPAAISESCQSAAP